MQTMLQNDAATLPPRAVQQEADQQAEQHGPGLDVALGLMAAGGACASLFWLVGLFVLD